MIINSFEDLNFCFYDFEVPWVVPKAATRKKKFVFIYCHYYYHYFIFYLFTFTLFILCIFFIYFFLIHSHSSNNHTFHISERGLCLLSFGLKSLNKARKARQASIRDNKGGGGGGRAYGGHTSELNTETGSNP